MGRQLSRALVVALFPLSMLGWAPSPPAALPNDVVVVSSTSMAGSFTMTATNLAGRSSHLELPAPVTDVAVMVDAGTWDGTTWRLELAPGATASMTG